MTVETDFKITGPGKYLTRAGDTVEIIRLSLSDIWYGRFTTNVTDSEFVAGNLRRYIDSPNIAYSSWLHSGKFNCHTDDSPHVIVSIWKEPSFPADRERYFADL